MATKDAKLVLDIYRAKDDRGETYYLNIIGIDQDGTETLLLDHINNRGATGAKLLQNLINRTKNDYQQIIVEEYRAFTPGSAGAVEPVQVHNIVFRNNKPAKPEAGDMFNMFGGFQGFVNFTAEQSRTKGQIEALNERIYDLKESKALLLTKLGNYEGENKKLELEIRNLQDKIRELRWKYEDQLRDARNNHDEELRKYKGQSAIISAGMQGVGGLLMKKLNVSPEDLAGFLGFDTETTGQETQQAGAQMPNVEVEAELSPEQQIIKQKADLIYQWCINSNAQVMEKVYAIFDAINRKEGKLNQLFQMAMK